MDYTLTESPVRKTTQQLLEGITAFTNQYQRLPESAKEFCENKFAAAMTVNYIIDTLDSRASYLSLAVNHSVAT